MVFVFPPGNVVRNNLKKSIKIQKELERRKFKIFRNPGKNVKIN
jgi:hypothetical protein